MGWVLWLLLGALWLILFLVPFTAPDPPPHECVIEGGKMTCPRADMDVALKSGT